MLCYVMFTFYCTICLVEWKSLRCPICWIYGGWCPQNSSLRGHLHVPSICGCSERKGMFHLDAVSHSHTRLNQLLRYMYIHRVISRGGKLGTTPHFVCVVVITRGCFCSWDCCMRVTRWLSLWRTQVVWHLLAPCPYSTFSQPKSMSGAQCSLARQMKWMRSSSFTRNTTSSKGLLSIELSSPNSTLSIQSGWITHVILGGGSWIFIKI